ncbi:hypothetical protein HK405_015008 [Cladochytrium tenue]|nr:hypothetical protein HK405_015008 [Cladochytrium tenue]
MVGLPAISPRSAASNEDGVPKHRRRRPRPKGDHPHRAAASTAPSTCAVNLVDSTTAVAGAAVAADSAQPGISSWLQTGGLLPSASASSPGFDEQSCGATTLSSSNWPDATSLLLAVNISDKSKKARHRHLNYKRSKHEAQKNYIANTVSAENGVDLNNKGGATAPPDDVIPSEFGLNDRKDLLVSPEAEPMEEEYIQHRLCELEEHHLYFEHGCVPSSEDVMDEGQSYPNSESNDCATHEPCAIQGHKKGYLKHRGPISTESAAQGIDYNVATDDSSQGFPDNPASVATDEDQGRVQAVQGRSPPPSEADSPASSDDECIDDEIDVNGDLVYYEAEAYEDPRCERTQRRWRDAAMFMGVAPSVATEFLVGPQDGNDGDEGPRDAGHDSDLEAGHSDGCSCSRGRLYSAGSANAEQETASDKEKGGDGAHNLDVETEATPALRSSPTVLISTDDLAKQGWSLIKDSRGLQTYLNVERERVVCGYKKENEDGSTVVVLLPNYTQFVFAQ